MGTCKCFHRKEREDVPQWANKILQRRGRRELPRRTQRRTLPQGAIRKTLLTFFAIFPVKNLRWGTPRRTREEFAGRGSAHLYSPFARRPLIESGAAIFHAQAHVPTEPA
jgi:hypothetical protein